MSDKRQGEISKKLERFLLGISCVVLGGLFISAAIVLPGRNEPNFPPLIDENRTLDQLRRDAVISMDASISRSLRKKVDEAFASHFELFEKTEDPFAARFFTLRQNELSLAELLGPFDSIFDRRIVTCVDDACFVVFLENCFRDAIHENGALAGTRETCTAVVATPSGFLDQQSGMALLGVSELDAPRYSTIFPDESEFRWTDEQKFYVSEGRMIYVDDNLPSFQIASDGIHLESDFTREGEVPFFQQSVFQSRNCVSIHREITTDEISEISMIERCGFVGRLAFRIIEDGVTTELSMFSNYRGMRATQ